MSFESKRRGYMDYESVKHIMFGFKILPMNLYLVKANFCLVNCCPYIIFRVTRSF